MRAALEGWWDAGLVAGQCSPPADWGSRTRLHEVNLGQGYYSFAARSTLVSMKRPLSTTTYRAPRAVLSALLARRRAALGGAIA